MTDNKVNRQQLSKVTGVAISPARIRGFLDSRGINKAIEDKLEKVKDQLGKLKKAGGPVLPKTLSKEEKENEALKTKYTEEVKRHHDYVSESYKTLETVYGLCKLLFKVHPLLLKKRDAGKQTDNQLKELEELLFQIQDKPVPKKASESEEAYKARAEKFERSGYGPLVGSTDVTNADAVQALANKLKAEHSDISLFLQRDELSKSRIRFNDPAAVALAVAMELAVEEFIEHGMDKTRESQKKTIQPDHCVSSGMEECSWYVFFRDLPHLKAVLDRQKRKLDYVQEKEKEKAKLIQKARIKSKKAKENYKRPKFSYPSFPEDEVAKGHAVQNTVTGVDAEGSTVTKVQYQWYGIDIDHHPVDDTTFSFYVQQVCKKIINRRAETTPEFLEIKISNNIRKFFSDLIIDFIARISPQIMLLIEAMDVKTVDHFVVKQALKMMLTQNYNSSNGVVEFSDDHNYLFTLIDEKVQLCQQHQTGQVHKSSQPEVHEPEAETHEPVGHEEDPTELAPAPTPTPVTVDPVLASIPSVAPAKTRPTAPIRKNPVSAVLKKI